MPGGDLRRCRAWGLCLFWLAGCEGLVDPGLALPHEEDAGSDAEAAASNYVSSRRSDCADPSPAPNNNVSPAPLLYYPFDCDARNVGTLGSRYDGVDTAVSYVPGRNGGAASVGFPHWISLPDTGALLRNLDELTIAMWVRLDFASGAYPPIDCRTADGGFQTYAVSGPQLITCWGWGGTAGGCSPLPLSSGDWHHLTYGCRRTPQGYFEIDFTLDGSSGFNAYGPHLLGVDAVDLWLGNAHEETSSDGTAWYGTALAGGRHDIDDLRVYDRVFEPRERCEQIIGGTFSDDQCVLP